MSSEYDNLKIQLEKLEWPRLYPFKFITKLEKFKEIEELFEGSEVKTKFSKNANYMSVSATLYMYSADKVIEIYEKAAKIGVMFSL